MARRLDASLFARTIELRIQIVSALDCALLLFHGNAMRIGPRILTNARDQPRNFHAGLVGLDRELMIGYFSADDGLRELSNNGELIAEIAV